MKRLYVKPNVNVVSMISHHFFAASKELFQYAANGSRKSDAWEEDNDDEEEDSMWK